MLNTGFSSWTFSETPHFSHHSEHSKHVSCTYSSYCSLLLSSRPTLLFLDLSTYQLLLVLLGLGVLKRTGHPFPLMHVFDRGNCQVGEIWPLDIIVGYPNLQRVTNVKVLGGMHCEYQSSLLMVSSAAFCVTLRINSSFRSAPRIATRMLWALTPTFWRPVRIKSPGLHEPVLSQASMESFSHLPSPDLVSVEADALFQCPELFVLEVYYDLFVVFHSLR